MAGKEDPILTSPQEFAEDLELRLGRANGNIYHRKPGVEGIHDGQVMVRLKKKRFIVIDYGIVPTEAQISGAAVNPHMSIPDGAGKQQCITPECTKVGIPVLLYDSSPEEPASLYMRSGLCFTCQRNLNEKRRTQRKRKSDILAEQQHQPLKKLHGLGPDTIVIQGNVDGAKHQGEGYGYTDIGPDLQGSISDASAAVDRLVEAVSASNGDPASVAFSAITGADDANTTSDDVSSLYDKAYTSMTKSVFLLTQWKASWDAAIAAAVANNAGLEDAVASAAAVVAASSVETGTNMIPLLLAADSKGGKKKDDTEVYSV